MKKPLSLKSGNILGGQSISDFLKFCLFPFKEDGSRLPFPSRLSLMDRVAGDMQAARNFHASEEEKGAGHNNGPTTS